MMAEFGSLFWDDERGRRMIYTTYSIYKFEDARQAGRIIGGKMLFFELNLPPLEHERHVMNWKPNVTTV